MQLDVPELRGYRADDAETGDTIHVLDYELYLDELRTSPLRPQSWGGLARTMLRLDRDCAVALLFDRAELIALLYHQIRASGGVCEVAELVDWLADARSST